MNFLIGDNLKIGIIGVGRWGKKHLDEYNKMKDVEIAYVSDLNKENLTQCIKKYNIKNFSTDYTDVLSSDVKAVSICSGNETHFNICKDALKAGKHVLVEKPITNNSKKAYELVDLAKKHKKILAVGHIFRFNNAINKVKELIKNKYFGDLYYLRFQWTIKWMSQLYPDKQLDIIIDMMPHLYDIMNHLTGFWPKKITCFAKDYIKKDLEDTAYIICEFPNNLLTHSEISWTLPERVREIDIIGDKATAKIQAISQDIEIFENSNEGKKLKIKENNTLGDELKNFLNSIKNNSTPINNGEVGAKTIELIEKTRLSLYQEKSITI